VHPRNPLRVFPIVTATTDEWLPHIANILPEMRQNKARFIGAFAFRQDFGEALAGEKISLSKHPSDPGSEGAMKIKNAWKPNEPKSQSAPAELLPACHAQWQENP
jgi:hypothetical protein